MTPQTWGVLLIVLSLWAVAWQQRSASKRQLILLLASYLFYLTWGIGFLFVLVVSSLINYFLGSLLRHRPNVARLWLGIAFNLLLLCFFKYLPPLLETGAVNEAQASVFRQIVMPVGISFWTFQALSYLFDIYREEELDPSLLEYCLYMAFWPTVLSGPVCRLPEMLPQFRQAFEFNSADMAVGLRRVIQGIIMKFAFAELLLNGVSPGGGIAHQFDHSPGGWGGLDVLLLAIGFGLQLFFDFAGYSHIMIGISRIFGIRLEENFARPFLATNPSVFWTRWHMSLSSWIRDYVFLPLARMRPQRWWTYGTLIISMTLFGLWHAATATFVLWGVYHGLLLVLHRLGQQIARARRVCLPRYLGVTLSWSCTFIVISLGWILFRATDLAQAAAMFRSIFSPASYANMTLPLSLYVLTTALFCGYLISTLVSSAVSDLRTRRSESNGTLNELALQFADIADQKVWWWLAPTSFVLIVVGIIVTVGIPVTGSRFAYTLF
jgi:alginate O-acetyltransferase complex protein AlgI